MPKVFFSYAHADEALRDELEKHLAMLRRQGVIDTWHDRRIEAGEPIDDRIDSELEEAQIVLLLVSPDFLASDYCYEREMRRAMERHDRGEARVIPVILRPCDWHGAPFGRLNAVPRDGRPVTKYPNQDESFLEITRAIREAAESFASARPESGPTQPEASSFSGAPDTTAQPRSSTLRLRKTFTDRDRDAFLDEAFEYVAQFFENSLNELKERNPGIDTRFRRMAANRFTAAVYVSGEASARCTIWQAGRDSFGPGIAVSGGDKLCH